MNVIFMGTPDFAVPSLRAVAASGHRIVAAVTQPDREKGRKRILTPPPVKLEAERLGIPVFQPVRLRGAEVVEQLEKLKPDLIVTAAYGQILPKPLLALPARGCINVHGSLLPKYRGGAPIQRALINGEEATGVTIMYMAEGLDTGDMISKVEVPIEAWDTAGSLFEKLSEAGAELLQRTLPAIAAGTARAVPQNHAEATYAPNLSREDERIDWRQSSVQIRNRIRGLNPSPGAFTTWNGGVMKIWQCAPVEPSAAAGGAALAPGTVIRADRTAIVVRTGDGAVSLVRIQPAGKKAMDIEEFSRGTTIPVGFRFGEDQGE